MKSPSSALAPILRSDTQGEILAALFMHPEHEYTMAELAGRAGTSVPTVLRELDRLTAAEVVAKRAVGRSRLFRANQEYPLYGPYSEIIRFTYGPVPVLEELLRAVPGIEEAYIYGSWATRRTGVEGPPPNDIDVLIVGASDRDALAHALSEAERRLGREVNARRTTGETWSRADDPFTRSVRERPLFPLQLSADGPA